MDFAELTTKVKRDHNIDIAHALNRYKALAPNPSIDSFLVYLRDQRVINNDVMTALLTAETVDTTDVDGKKPAQMGLRGTVYTHASASGDAKVTAVAPTVRSAEDDTHVEANGHAQAHVSEAPPGEQAQYAVLGELGKGAMGEVHVARDLVLRRKVALKSILPAMQENPALFSRFLGEMQITAQLDHPFIVPVYGVENGPSGGLAYAMKLVQGKEFGVLLEETKELLHQNKPLDEAHSLEGRLEAFLKVCDAIAYAHERGVVHRDLKPANIMIGRFNEVYVMDWGIARLIKKGAEKLTQAVEMYDADGADARSTTRTRVGSTIGTPIYMSPGASAREERRARRAERPLLARSHPAGGRHAHGRRRRHHAGGGADDREGGAPHRRPPADARHRGADADPRDHRQSDAPQPGRSLPLGHALRGRHPPLPAQRGDRRAARHAVREDRPVGQQAPRGRDIPVLRRRPARRGRRGRARPLQQVRRRGSAEPGAPARGAAGLVRAARRGARRRPPALRERAHAHGGRRDDGDPDARAVGAG
ncbi:MAG: serine/threonine-protein kinase [Polyangiaceae bacterium]